MCVCMLVYGFVNVCVRQMTNIQKRTKRRTHYHAEYSDNHENPKKEDSEYSENNENPKTDKSEISDVQLQL